MRERKLIWTILSLTLIASVFSALNVHQAKAQPLTVSVSPASNAYDPGQQFTISIDIANVLSLWAWELKLRYEPAYLYTNYTALPPPAISLIQKGTFLSQNGLLSTYFPDPFFGATYIQMSEVIQTYDSTSGSGTLVTITFIVQGWGWCNLEIYDLKLFDPDQIEIIPDSVSGAIFNNNSPNAGIYTVKEPLSLELAEVNVMYNVSRDAAYKLKFNVTVWNTGPGSQTFDVKFYYNSSATWNATTLAGLTQIGTTVAVSNLASRGSQLVQFSWDPAGIRAHIYNYTLTFVTKISGMASDANVYDNTKLSPLPVEILMGGDCNWEWKTWLPPPPYAGNPIPYVWEDGRVNYKDLGILAVNYGKRTPPIGNGDPRADFNADTYINYKDLGTLAVNYGKVYS